MGPIAISLIVFACVFGGAVFGMILRSRKAQLSADSKDVVKLGCGLVSTMCAVVLGLLVASAKGSYDTQNNELTEMSAKVVLLDRVLAHYGPETKEVRDVLRSIVASFLARTWPKEHASSAQLEAPSRDAEAILDTIQGLSPKDDRQRLLQGQATSIVLALVQTRWLQYVQGAVSVPIPLLVILVFWLTVVFATFGLLAPLEGTVVSSLLVSALSVSATFFLILGLYSPYVGLIQVSSSPVRAALTQLGN
jgi:hypothetical protein